ncbi:toll-like receptor 3 [Biomphalaria pfeifferi]|uniref:Toll-like receptor 3 n=1 Tax=Biomphalaria pfeifferi TaxID=112525 RepID=A0AAD8C6R8_BIOPF|nr:toll-like receptor 3 [Biomphalaria pfeifferi]
MFVLKRVFESQAITMLLYAFIVLSLNFTKEGNSLSEYNTEIFGRSKRYLFEGQCQCTDIACNCSGQGLSTVPKNLSASIRVLDLSNNMISNLSDGCFYRYTELQYLNLSSNNIAKLQVGSFASLNKLLELNLRENKLCYNNLTFPKGVFGDLTSLLLLKLDENSDPSTCENSTYPDNSFANFTRLKILHLDGLNNQTLGPGFRALVSLENLTLSSNFCNLTSLYNDTFLNVGRIKLLDISHCKLVGSAMENGSLVPLKNLTVLDMSYNFRIEMIAFSYVIREIRNYKLEILKVNFIRPGYAIPFTINRTFIDCLPRSLTYLEADGCNFVSVETKSLSHLPSNLRYLSLKNNRFSYGHYITKLKNLAHLEEINLRGGDLNDFPDTLFNEAELYSSQSENKFAQQNDFIFQLPPNVIKIDISYCGISYKLKSLKVDPNNSLEVLNINNNYFPFLIGPIVGLNQLKSLNLSHCSVRNISDKFFMNLSSLNKLFLGHNSIGELLVNSHYTITPFISLKQLTRLDLSHNGLTIVYRDMLSGLTELQELLMNNNDMWHFNITIDHMFNLRLINLSHNQIKQLPLDFREHIDILTKDPKKKLLVDFSSNPIPCDCQNLDLIQWMVSSRAFDHTFKDYICTYSDESYKKVQDAFEETLQKLRHACADNSPVFLLATLSTLIMIIMLMAIILYRFRWQLRYLYYAAYLKVKDGHRNQETKSYVYDVFVSYAHQDETFVVQRLIPELSNRGLNVFVHGRDFVVGDYIASNILTAIRKSTKTLVVLTKSLIESTWCNYELQMANMESVHTGRQVLVFLIKDSLDITDLKTDLLYHIKNNTYIEYPHGPREIGLALNLFWDKLSLDLKN